MVGPLHLHTNDNGKKGPIIVSYPEKNGQLKEYTLKVLMKENSDKKQVWTCSTYIFSNDIDVFPTFGAKSSEKDPIGIICSSWHRRSLHRSSTVNKVIRWPLGFITLNIIKAKIIGES